MSSKATRHELADKPFVGTPRPLPRVLFCHVPQHWCGRHWTVNTVEAYEAALMIRDTHQVLCTNSKSEPLWTS